ncbi:MAG: hypothetical protein L0H59_05295 [Tomitella sp.]|nr:hypothetical protein [Tomitella sp.]
MNTRTDSTPRLAIPVWRLRSAAAQAAELDPHVTADEVLAELAEVPFVEQWEGHPPNMVTLAGQARSAGLPTEDMLSRYERAADAGLMRWRGTAQTVIVSSQL